MVSVSKSIRSVLAAALFAAMAVSVQADEDASRSSAVVDASGESSDIATVYCIDASEPGANKFTDAARFIVNADSEKGDTRVLVALPGLDLPTVESLGVLHFDAILNWRGNPEIPAFANVLSVPFGTTEATAATWNFADHSDPETAWEGGTAYDAEVFPAVFGENSVEFDLSGLLASDLRDAAFSNGLLLQWDVSQRGAITNSHVKHTLFRSDPAPALAWTQRPVSHSYIDSGKPGNNFGWSGAEHAKCIVTLNSGTGEARTLVKFASTFFGFDPARDRALLLSFPYWKEWPGEEEPNEIAIQPLASPFRMDQATWNSAATGTAWTTPGGDLDEAVSVIGSVDREAQVITFDMTPLFRNPAALAELLENGAVLRILGDHPESSGSVGFNFYGTDGPVAVAIAADGVEFRGVSCDPAAGTRFLDLTGLDPTADYAVYVCTDLVAGDWTWACNVPDDGQVTLPAADAPAFYRVQTRE